MKKLTSSQQEQGYVLLLTLITLVVLLFGVLFVTRGNLLQTVMTGNTIQRQKDVQVGDLALRQVQSAIVQNACGGNPNTCQLLLTTAQGQAWFPVIDAASPMPWTGTAPDQTFWSSCLAQNTCDTLAHIRTTVLNSKPPALPGSANIQVVVVPATLPPDPSACTAMTTNGAISATNYTANYYEIFLNIREANGETGAKTDNVFKLCTVT